MKLVTFSSLALMIFQVLIASVTTSQNFYICILCFASSSSVLKVAMSNALSVAAGKTQKGEVLGVAGSVMSICRAVAPMASGMLVEMYDVSTPGYVAACSMGIVCLIGPIFVPTFRSKRNKDITATTGTGTATGTTEEKERLKLLIDRNANQVARLEKKMIRLTSTKKKKKQTKNEIAVLQLEEVYQNRVGSSNVAKKLYENKIMAKETILKKIEKKKKNTLFVALWTMTKNTVFNFRLPILVYIIYAMYIRRGRLKN